MKKGREVPQYLPSVAGVSTFGVMKAHDAPPQARLLRRRRARSLGRSRWITNLVNLVASAGAKTPRHIARVCATFVTFRNIAPAFTDASLRHPGSASLVLTTRVLNCEHEVRGSLKVKTAGFYK